MICCKISLLTLLDLLSTPSTCCSGVRTLLGLLLHGRGCCLSLLMNVNQNIPLSHGNLGDLSCVTWNRQGFLLLLCWTLGDLHTVIIIQSFGISPLPPPPVTAVPRRSSFSHLLSSGKRSPFKAWSRSVYSHTCYASCQEFLSCLFLHFRSIHLHFFPKPLPIFPVLAVANTWFLCRPAE